MFEVCNLALKTAVFKAKFGYLYYDLLRCEDSNDYLDPCYVG